MLRVDNCPPTGCTRVILARIKRFCSMGFFTNATGPAWWRALKIGFGVRVLENMAWSMMGSAILGTPWMETFHRVDARQFVGGVFVAPILETMWVASSLWLLRMVRVRGMFAAVIMGVIASMLHPDTVPIMRLAWVFAFFIYTRVWQAESARSIWKASALVALAHAYDNMLWALINTAQVGLYGDGWTVFPHRCILYVVRFVVGGVGACLPGLE